MNRSFAVAVVAVSGIGALAFAALADGARTGNTLHLGGGGLMATLFLAGLVALARVVILGERERRRR